MCFCHTHRCPPQPDLHSDAGSDNSDTPPPTMSDGPQLQDLEELTDMEKIAKGWSIAMFYSKERLQRVHSLTDGQLDKAVQEGRLVLETLCLFVHACIKRGQYRLPSDFWKVLHLEYGIIVYPSAMMEEIDVQGLGVDVTFTEAYAGHIGKNSATIKENIYDILMLTGAVMYGRCPSSCHPPPCPFQYMNEPPPVYEK